MNTEIWRAEVEDLDLLVPLFDAYRQFYKFQSAFSPLAPGDGASGDFIFSGLTPADLQAA